MKILDIIVSKLAIIFMGAISIILIILPFNNMNMFLSNIINQYMNTISHDYIYSVIGAMLLILGIKALFAGINDIDKGQRHIITPMNFGDLIISEEAIKGITHHVITRTVGIRDTKITVDFNQNGLEISIKGQVSPEIDIPDMTRNIQIGVKETVQKNTGLEVSSVSIEISSISSPVKTLR